MVKYPYFTFRYLPRRKYNFFERIGYGYIITAKSLSSLVNISKSMEFVQSHLIAFISIVR